MLRDDGRLLNELLLDRDPFSSLIVAFCSVISNLYAFFFSGAIYGAWTNIIS